MSKEQLQAALAEVAAERTAALERLEEIRSTKERFRRRAREMADAVRAKAEQGDVGAEIAYMNLVRGQKLTE